MQADLADLEPAEFTSFHILDRVPAIFKSRQQYASWRSQIAEGLGVDPLNLLVVGSTCVGVSLSPSRDKFMRPFHSGSDIDLAVVSDRHFDEAWRWLRNLGPIDTLRQTSKDAADLLQWHKRSLVFDGTIATERLLSHLPFGAEWAAVLGRAGRVPPTENRDVNARIYRDFDSLRAYHEKNVRALRLQVETSALTDEGPTDSASAEKGK